MDPDFLETRAHLLFVVVVPYVARMALNTLTKFALGCAQSFFSGAFGIRAGAIGPFQVCEEDFATIKSHLRTCHLDPDVRHQRSAEIQRLFVRLPYEEVWTRESGERVDERGTRTFRRHAHHDSDDLHDRRDVELGMRLSFLQQRLVLRRIVLGRKVPCKLFTGIIVHKGSILLPGNVYTEAHGCRSIAFYHPGLEFYYEEWDTGGAMSGKLVPVDVMRWDEAQLHLQYHPWAMYVSCGLRLVFWHLLQPAAYFVVLKAYWQQIDLVQQILGSFVAVREVLYAYCCIILARKHPSFLLFDPVAVLIKESGVTWFAVVCFLCSPEKFIAQRYLDIIGDSSRWILNFTLMVALPLDSCALAALIVGHCSGTLHSALAFGYGVAVVGASVAVVDLVWHPRANFLGAQLCYIPSFLFGLACACLAWPLGGLLIAYWSEESNTPM